MVEAIALLAGLGTHEVGQSTLESRGPAGLLPERRHRLVDEPSTT